ncbi:hypothetical protein EVAR_54713_1 [Eumeta japonica]|uniref:Reverse transcriptase domain-containing protein n=1 Tax=Eumeta variegata TaxID=151549 RepID=A0A4C1YLN4_EUMVA|nr:hypothetical protein EVAR_54713_1 [Eumeta japonica]
MCINGLYTDWFDIRRGVRQGCVASPWLFNLFMDSCLYDLKQYECGLRMNELSAEPSVKYLLYADGEVLLASSACGLLEMVNKVNGSVKKRSVKVNFGKARLAIHNGVLIPMYGSESWIWQKKNDSRINAVETGSLRSMCAVSRKDRCRNSDVRKRSIERMCVMERSARVALENPTQTILVAHYKGPNFEHSKPNRSACRKKIDGCQ